jgi:hypothetical protein
VTESKWAEIPGLNDVYPPPEGEDEYEITEVSADEEPSPENCEFAVQVCFPKFVRWVPDWVPGFKYKTSVWLWSKKFKWKPVAKFVTQQAGYDYAVQMSRELEQIANEIARRKR